MPSRVSRFRRGGSRARSRESVHSARGELRIVHGPLRYRPAAQVRTGNTADPVASRGRIDKLRRRFGLNRVVPVGERGTLAGGTHRRSNARGRRSGPDRGTAQRCHRQAGQRAGAAARPHGLHRGDPAGVSRRVPHRLSDPRCARTCRRPPGTNCASGNVSACGSATCRAPRGRYPDFRNSGGMSVLTH